MYVLVAGAFATRAQRRKTFPRTPGRLPTIQEEEPKIDLDYVKSLAELVRNQEKQVKDQVGSGPSGLNKKTRRRNAIHIP